jgi:hypothetical protein
VFVIVSLIFSFQSGAQTISPTIISDPSQNFLVNTGVEYLEDKNHIFTIGHVSRGDNFNVLEKGIPNFATTASAYWLRIRLRNETDRSKLLLKVSAPTLDSISFTK